MFLLLDLDIALFFSFLFSTAQRPLLCSEIHITRYCLLKLLILNRKQDVGNVRINLHNGTCAHQMGRTPLEKSFFPQLFFFYSIAVIVGLLTGFNLEICQTTEMLIVLWGGAGLSTGQRLLQNR